MNWSLGYLISSIFPLFVSKSTFRILLDSRFILLQHPVESLNRSVSSVDWLPWSVPKKLVFLMKYKVLAAFYAVFCLLGDSSVCCLHSVGLLIKAHITFVIICIRMFFPQGHYKVRSVISFGEGLKVQSKIKASASISANILATFLPLPLNPKYEIISTATGWRAG